MEDNKTFEEVLDELREADPFRHDLLLTFHNYARGVELQRQAVGVLVAMIGELHDRVTAAEGGSNE